MAKSQVTLVNQTSNKPFIFLMQKLHKSYTCVEVIFILNFHSKNDLIFIAFKLIIIFLKIYHEI